MQELMRIDQAKNAGFLIPQRDTSGVKARQLGTTGRGKARTAARIDTGLRARPGGVVEKANVPTVTRGPPAIAPAHAMIKTKVFLVVPCIHQGCSYCDI